MINPMAIACQNRRDRISRPDPVETHFQTGRNSGTYQTYWHEL
ncbi:MAG: hypothetical protein ACKOYJ_10215 [Planctomycetia bacterium]